MCKRTNYLDGINYLLHIAEEIISELIGTVIKYLKMKQTKNNFKISKK